MRDQVAYPLERPNTACSLRLVTSCCGSVIDAYARSITADATIHSLFALPRRFSPARCRPGAAIPGTAVAAIRRYCDNKVLVQHQHELRVECDVRGKSITIYECRPPWRPELGPEWTRQPVAQLRYDPDDHHWRLYAADRNGRWHRYDMADPTARLDELLTEIDRDPTGIFWG